MLDIITKSKIRQKIILLFINNKSSEFYINEIARLINSSAGTVQRELNKLLGIGFLIYSRRGNMVFFKLNEANPLLKELETIVNKTIGIEATLRENLKGLKGLCFAFIFGSYAKGKLSAGSDIDLYVIGDFDEDLLHEILNKVEKNIYREVNPHISTLSEFKRKLKKSYFEKEIVSKCILIAGKESEFAEIIKRS